MVGGSILMVPISKDFDPLGYRSSTTGDIIPGRDFLRKLRGLPCSQQIPTCVMYVMVGIYICLTASSIPAGYFVLTRALNLVPEVNKYLLIIYVTEVRKVLCKNACRILTIFFSPLIFNLQIIQKVNGTHFISHFTGIKSYSTP